MSVTLPPVPPVQVRFPLPGRFVDYCDGPSTYGVADAFPRSTRWAAWIASAGVRIGQRTIVRAPADDQGGPSYCWPTERGYSVSIAFDAVGREVTALEETDGSFRIRHDASGGLATYGPFTGTTPRLYQIAQLSREAGTDDVLCFYLKPTTDPKKLFLRVQRDNYAVEYTLNADTEQALFRLQKVDTATGQRLRIYARTQTGIQARLTGDAYNPFPMLADDPGASIRAAATGGAYIAVVIAGGSFSDPGAAIRAAATGGAYVAVVVSGGNVSDFGAAIRAAATGGDYVAVVISGGNLSDPGAAIRAAATGGSYDVVIVTTSTQSDPGAAIRAAATGGSYDPV